MGHACVVRRFASAFLLTTRFGYSCLIMYGFIYTYIYIYTLVFILFSVLGICIYNSVIATRVRLQVMARAIA